MRRESVTTAVSGNNAAITGIAITMGTMKDSKCQFRIMAQIYRFSNFLGMTTED